MKHTVIISVLAGVLSGAVSAYIFSPRPAQQTPQSPEPNVRQATVLQLKGLTIVDENGRRRATLGVNPSTSATALAFYAADTGALQAELGIRPDGASELSFHEPDRTPILMSAETNGSVRLYLNGEGRSGLVLGASLDKRTAIVINDTSGQHRTAIGLTDKGEAHATLYDSAGKLLWSVP